jgi:hypothetical protein
METRATAPKDSGFRSMAEFYPFYLSEHLHPVSRVLHYIGTWGSVLSLVALLVTAEPLWLLGALGSGYGLAWFGHFLFEHNKPATFTHPFYSFAGDWVMFRDILMGRIRL